MTEEKHIAELLLEYAIQQGATHNEIKSELWVDKIDDKWTVKLNGTQEKLDGIEPLSWYLEFNGWPAGIISILGDGMLCAGEAGNEENLRAAIELKMKTVIP